MFLLLIITAIVLCALLTTAILSFNKTFFETKYTSDFVSGVNIPIPKYSYYRGTGGMDAYTAKLKTLKQKPTIEQVKKAIEDLEKTVSDGFKRIGKAISEVSCGKETLSAADTSMQPVIDSVAESIAGGTSDDVAPIAVQMGAALDDVYTRAVEAHNDIQKQLNSNAESSCRGTDVVRVC